jgi:hypothetical protein
MNPIAVLLNDIRDKFLTDNRIINYMKEQNG